MPQCQQHFRWHFGSRQGRHQLSSYTKGDLIVASGATVLGKLGVGTNGQRLEADSTQPLGLNGQRLAGTVTQ